MGCRLPEEVGPSLSVFDEDPGVYVCTDEMHFYAQVYCWSKDLALDSFMAAAGLEGQMG